MRKLPRKFTIKSARINKLEIEFGGKKIYAQFAKYLDQPHVNKEQSNKWPKFSTLEVASATFLLVCFVCLKESTCKTRKNAFYFTSKALLVLEIIKF